MSTSHLNQTTPQVDDAAGRALILERSPAGAGWRQTVSDLIGGRAWRRAGYSVVMLPLALLMVAGAVLGFGDSVLRWHSRARHWIDGRPGPNGPAGAGSLGLISIPIASIALLVVYFLVPNTVRNLTYPLSHSQHSDYADAWGGPTLAGAWAVHAALVVLLIPVYLLVLRALGGLQDRVADRVFAGRRTWWLGPVIVALTLVVALFVKVWLHQV